MTIAKTSIFRTPQKDILLLLLRKHAMWAIISTLALIVVFCVLAIALADVRYAILSLMVVCIIAPMIMAMLYFFHALKPDVVFNVLPHSLELTQEGLKITLFECKNERGEEEKNITEEEGYGVRREEGEINSKKEPEYIAISERFIRYDSMKGVEVGLNNVVFPIGDSGYLFIPQSAFASGEDFKEFVLGLSDARN